MLSSYKVPVETGILLSLLDFTAVSTKFSSEKNKFGEIKSSPQWPPTLGRAASGGQLVAGPEGTSVPAGL